MNKSFSFPNLMGSSSSRRAGSPSFGIGVPAGITLLVGLLSLLLVFPLVNGNAIISFGLIYVGCFIAIAWKYPHIALLLIFATAPLQNDLSGGGAGAKFSLTEVNAILTAAIYIIQGVIRKQAIFNLGPLALPILGYFLVCIYSSLHNWLGQTALISILQMVIYLVLTVLIFAKYSPNYSKNQIALKGLIVVGVVLAIIKCIKFRDLYILGLHKNGVGASLTCAIIVAIELWLASSNNPKQRRWLLASLMLMATALILTLSRGAWLGAAVGITLLMLLRRQIRTLLVLLAVLIPFISLAWFVLPQDSREYATSFDSTRYNIKLRLNSIETAKKHWDRNKLIGDGVGWRKLYDATNTPMLLLAETGVLGLLTFTLIHIAFAVMVWQAQKQLDRRDPLYSFLAIGTALVFSKLAHGLVDHYWSRGAVSAAWAGAGFALGVYFEVKKRSRIQAQISSLQIVQPLRGITK